MLNFELVRIILYSSFSYNLSSSLEVYSMVISNKSVVMNINLCANFQMLEGLDKISCDPFLNGSYIIFTNYGNFHR